MKMAHGENDPINTLSQWEIWRIEADVLAKVAGGIITGVLLIIAAIWGEDACEFAFGTVMVSLVIGFVVAVILAIKYAVFGPSQATVDRAFARGNAMLHKAMGPNWRDP
jgi:hypothetical protein